jgi:hypothetical protein
MARCDMDECEYVINSDRYDNDLRLDNLYDMELTPKNMVRELGRDEVMYIIEKLNIK